MKKIIFIAASFYLFSQSIPAAPMGKLPIMVSRANCFAFTPVGIGNHNESLSYYINDQADMWVRTFQTSRQGSTRAIDSGFKYNWRVYSSFVDMGGATRTIWSVVGNHIIRFSISNMNSSTTSATDCNLGEGWPWNYANPNA